MRIFCLCLISLLCVVNIYSQDNGYYFDGEVGSYKLSLSGKGFGAENDITTELQALIEDVSSQAEGGTIVLSGEIQIKRIYLRSNVHLNIQKGTVIRGSYSKPAIINLSSDSEDHIENVAIYCGNCDRSAPNNDDSEKYIIDVSEYSMGDGFRAFMLGSVSNFWISDFYVRDVKTRFSALTMNPIMRDMTNDPEVHKALRDWEVVDSPCKGDIRYSHTENAHTGYGLVQTQSARNVYFEQISGVGGVTLRMESGAGIQFVGTDNEREKGTITGIVARDVSLTNGFSTVTLSPHGRVNGSVSLEDIRAYSSALAIKIATGFFDRELNIEVDGEKVLIDSVKFRKGRFEGPVIVKDAHSVFGLNASGRYGHEYLYVEKSIRDEYPWDSLTYMAETQKSKRIPSITTLGYKSIPNANAVADTLEGEYYAEIEGKVTGEGYPDCIDYHYGFTVFEDDKENVDCSLYPPDPNPDPDPDTTTTSSLQIRYERAVVFPNPAGDRFYVTHKSASKISIFNSCGSLVMLSDPESNGITEIGTTEFPKGLYFIRIRTEKELINERLLII